MPKHRSRARCRCVWVGQGFGGFLDLREKVFFLMQCTGAVLPPAGRVFYETFCHLALELNGIRTDELRTRKRQRTYA